MTIDKAGGRSPLSGARLAAALAAIVFATAVVPPAAAWALNEARIARTRADVRAAVERLRIRANDWGSAAPGGVACGPGRLPELEPRTATAQVLAETLPTHQGWLLGARNTPELFGSGMPTDAWKRCFLMNPAGRARQGPVWLLSAGPNGLIETAQDALTLAGDDIGARVR